MIKVKTVLGEATIKNYRWSSSDPKVAKLFNRYLKPYGPSPSDPYPDKTAADEIVRIFKGRIIEQVDPVNDNPPNTIY